MNEETLLIPIVKIDRARRRVYGIGTVAVPDKIGEELDWETSVPEIQAWSQRIEKASNGKSKFNVRAMHPRTKNFDSVGVGVSLTIDHKRKCVPMVIDIIDDWAWEKVEKGAYNGLSMGGFALRKWEHPTKPGVTKYTLRPSEVSLVDSAMIEGCNGLVIMKSDGSWDYIETSKGETMSEVTQPPVDHKAIAQETATAVATETSSRIEKMFGTKINDLEAKLTEKDARIEKMEQAIDSIAESLKALADATVRPAKATATPVSKSDDGKPPAEATTEPVEKSDFAPAGSGRSFWGPETIEKGDVTALIDGALGKPEIPFFLREQK